MVFISNADSGKRQSPKSTKTSKRNSRIKPLS
jgi:hypothetical protein